MPWGAAIGAGASLLGSALQDNKNGGAGTTTSTKEPWLAAQPWIQQNLATGQNLENQYLANPQSPAQRAAVANIYGQSDYMRNLIPSLLGQLGQQQVGFDPSNPTAKPNAWRWDGILGAGPDLHQTGLQAAAATLPAPAAAPAAAVSPLGQFVQDATPAGNYMRSVSAPAPAVGSYGAFKYGDQPAPGSPADTDRRMYFALGGADPRNLYGLGAAPSASGGL